MLYAPGRCLGTLITFRGREYDVAKRGDVTTLAAVLNASHLIDSLRGSGARQDEITQTLWQLVLSQRPGSLTDADIAGGAR